MNDDDYQRAFDELDRAHKFNEIAKNDSATLKFFDITED